MIKDVLDAQQLEWQSDEKNIVGRVASLNDIETPEEINPPCVHKLPK